MSTERRSAADLPGLSDPFVVSPTQIDEIAREGDTRVHLLATPDDLLAYRLASAHVEQHAELLRYP